MTVEYLNGKVFEAALFRYRGAQEDNNPAELAKAQLELVGIFTLLARNIIRKYHSQFVDNDDAVQECVMICIDKSHKFNPLKGNCFNYFSTIQINAIKQMYRNNRNYNELKIKFHKYLCDKGGDAMLIGLKARKKASGYKSNSEEPRSD